MCSKQLRLSHTGEVFCRKFCIWEIIGGTRSKVSGSDLLAVMSAQADDAYA